MEYQVHAFPNDNIIYYKGHVSKDKCPKCDESRNQTDKVTTTDKRGNDPRFQLIWRNNPTA